MTYYTPEKIVEDAYKAPSDFSFDQYFKNITVDGLFAEFGVAYGTSINRIAKSNPAKTIYGFDSFNGLPEDWGILNAGTFQCTVPVVLGNVELVIGLYQSTLVPWLTKHAGNMAFAHMDSDIYSSTKYVLDKLTPRCVPGTILAFDEILLQPCADFRLHEAKAFAEFLNETGFDYECLGHFGKESFDTVPMFERDLPPVVDKAGFRLMREP